MYLKIQVFWAVTSCPLVNSYRGFNGLECLHVQDKAAQDPENEGITICQKVRKYFPVDTAVTFQKT
jgi:hypothetical protein